MVLKRRCGPKQGDAAERHLDQFAPDSNGPERPGNLQVAEVREADVTARCPRKAPESVDLGWVQRIPADVGDDPVHVVDTGGRESDRLQLRDAHRRALGLPVSLLSAAREPSSDAHRHFAQRYHYRQQQPFVENPLCDPNLQRGFCQPCDFTS